EQNVYGVSSAQLADRIGEKARYCGSFASTAAAIREEAREGDLVIVMGAGDVFQVFDLLWN
ncbi:MAG: UDP-N-acetylmuramate--L-alanine ligase, partial [Clostridia bacterium]|nr:UDP-N-acetylmuramate--L-alanine ligase [Clostridia bacterium]